MRRLLAASAALLVLAGCGTAKWEERGFDSEAECWQNHGWDGSIGDGADRKEFFDFWCGPKDGG